MDATTILFPTLMMYLVGFYLSWQGWTKVRNPHMASLAPFDSLTLILTRVFQGKAKAKELKARFLKPDNVKRSGYYSLIVGVGLLMAGCLQVFAGMLSMSSR